AEDGIRHFHVTGVQTCALPISLDDPAVPCSFPCFCNELPAKVADDAVGFLLPGAASFGGVCAGGEGGQPGSKRTVEHAESAITCCSTWGFGVSSGRFREVSGEASEDGDCFFGVFHCFDRGAPQAAVAFVEQDHGHGHVVVDD